MRLLDRYLLRELLIPLGYCLSGFLLLWSAFDLIAKLQSFQEAKMTASDCLEFYMVTAPETFVLLAPVALLLALLWAVSNHARHNEFTAMRAAGISLWRLSVPYLAVGAVMSAAVFVVNEFWAPGTQDRVEQIRHRRVGAVPDRLTRRLIFHNEADHRDWDIRLYNASNGEMVQPSVTWLLPDGSFKDIHASSAMPTNGGWVFQNVEMYTYKATKDLFPVYNTNALIFFPFSETPELIHSEIRVNRIELKQTANRAQLAISEIFNYLRLHPQADHGRRALLMTQLQGRLAAPFTCLTVVLIAIPFGAKSGRRNVFVGVASSIVICFVYIILQSVSLALGNSGWLPPVAAAWLPNSLFGLIGGIMTTRVR